MIPLDLDGASDSSSSASSRKNCVPRLIDGLASIYNLLHRACSIDRGRNARARTAVVPYVSRCCRLLVVVPDLHVASGSLMKRLDPLTQRVLLRILANDLRVYWV